LLQNLVEINGVKARPNVIQQGSFLMPSLREQLDARQPLYPLAERMPWEFFDQEFGAFYSEQGRPAKPVRLMVGLLLLKQMFNLGDETVVAQWVQNPYWQFFCGEEQFQWKPPCDPSDLVHLRNRIGVEGATLVSSRSQWRYTGNGHRRRKSSLTPPCRKRTSPIPPTPSSMAK
jgi:transposase, IS5 family